MDLNLAKVEDATAGGHQDGANLIGKMNVTMGPAMRVKIINGVLEKTHGIPLAMEHIATRTKDEPTASPLLLQQLQVSKYMSGY